MTIPNLEPAFDAINFGQIKHKRIKIRPMYYELGFSPYPDVYGRRVVLEKILSALEHIPQNYGLTIWDVYRPRAVQKKLFEWMRSEIKKMNPALTDEENLTETQKYIASPSQVGDDYCPPHLSGGAVDLTLHACATGKELEMGTEFDDCTQRSHRDYFERDQDLDKQSILIREHRRILKCAMESASFTSYQHEWWHFDYGNILWQKVTGKQAFFGPLFNDLEWPLDANASNTKKQGLTTMKNPDQYEQPKVLYLDDFQIGARYLSNTHTLDEEQIMTFARQFDPQPFHLDDNAARATLFGGLAASGWHTAAITMRLIVTGPVRYAGGMIGAGVELNWPTPTRPGDILQAESEIESITPSRSRPDHGIVVVKTITRNQRGQVVQEMRSKMMVPRCPSPNKQT